METKPLLYGLGGFFIGGLIVSIAATTFDRPQQAKTDISMTSSMEASASTLKSKTGDEFDAAFLSDMIAHHEGAVEMAKLAATNAKHDEVKDLSRTIISAQQSEIIEMRQWQSDWAYKVDTSRNHTNGH